MSFWDFVSKSEWPAVVLILAIYFRSVVKSLLDGLRITKASFGGGSVEFQTRIDNLENIALSQDKSNLSSETKNKNHNDSSEKNQYSKDSLHWSEINDWLLSSVTPDVPPPYMIIMYWNQLEKALLNATERLYSANIILAPRRNASMPVLWRDAVKSIKLDRQTLFGIGELNKLRNEAAHGKEINISTTDALRYRDLAIQYISNINDTVDAMLRENSKKTEHP